MGALEELINFTSLGMLILDEVHLPCGKVVENVIGGSGSYASLGARLFCPKKLSTQVGWTIRTGHDFPAETLKQLESWGMTLSVIQESKYPSTRGQLKYLDPTFATKSFKYTTPTLTVQPEHLRDIRLLTSSGFHFFVDPAQIVEQTMQLQELRKAAGITTRPTVVWEPKAYSCAPENLPAFLEAMRVVNVFSPNHIELARIVRKNIPPVLNESFFEDLCAPFFTPQNSGSTSQAVLVVRAGDQGCFIKSHTEQKWLPAYYASQDSVKATTSISKVVDTTGAGNAFLGALTIGLLRSSNNVIFAAYAGNVAASFVVEQVGVPTLSSSEDGTELWNGEDVSIRFQAYRARVS